MPNGSVAPLRMTGGYEREIFCQKNLGDASASPVCCLLILLLVLLFLLCLFLGCHGSILPFHFSWTCYSNGRLLQLIECIESLKSDVKKKMMLARACDRYTKVTREGWRRNFRECTHNHRTFLPRKSFRHSRFFILISCGKNERPMHPSLPGRSEFQSLFRRPHL